MELYREVGLGLALNAWPVSIQVPISLVVFNVTLPQVSINQRQDRQSASIVHRTQSVLHLILFVKPTMESITEVV